MAGLRELGAMEQVSIKVLRLNRYPAGTRFEVYADLGTGSMDYAHPLTPRPVEMWPGESAGAGHLQQAHLYRRHLHAVLSDGHLETLHIQAEHLRPAAALTVLSPTYVFGRFSHAVRILDAAGNYSADPPATDVQVVNSAPREVCGLRRADYDFADDQFSFVFNPSRFTPLRGI